MICENGMAIMLRSSSHVGQMRCIDMQHRCHACFTTSIIALGLQQLDFNVEFDMKYYIFKSNACLKTADTRYFCWGMPTRKVELLAQFHAILSACFRSVIVACAYGEGSRPYSSVP